jgi:class 3 adenylate cyclase
MRARGGLRRARAIAAGVGSPGLEVRVGVHTGEIDLIDGHLGGIAPHIGGRVAARVRASEVLVSSIVEDLTASSVSRRLRSLPRLVAQSVSMPPIALISIFGCPCVPRLVMVIVPLTSAVLSG